MKAPHSKSLLLVWQLSEFEAKRLGAKELLPVHFLIGLAKSVDVDWIEAVNKEITDRAAILEELLREMRTVREEMERVGLEPKNVRRRLRKVLAQQEHEEDREKLRRGAEARQTFKAAEKLAVLDGTPVYPRHLLCAIAESASETVLSILRSAGIEPARLRKAGAGQTAQGNIALLGQGTGLN